MPFPCVLSPVPAPSNSLFTSRHHAQIHHPQFSITHSPLDSLKSGFQIKCFTEDAFSDISVLLIENPMVSYQSSDLTPLQYLRQIFSPVFFFSSMPPHTVSTVSINLHCLCTFVLLSLKCKHFGRPLRVSFLFSAHLSL